MTSHMYVTLPALLFLVNLGGGFCQDWCKVTSCQGNAAHTMCQYKAGGPATCSQGNRGLSEDEKKVIVAYHNELRARVAKGEEPSQPPASDMNELQWDEEIAQIAQRWIEQCQFQLEHDACRNARDGTYVGQNLARKWSSGVGEFADRAKNIKDMILMWYNEYKQFHKSNINNWWNVNAMIGHYTQVVWAKTTHVGCGLYIAKNDIKLACNYKEGGNVMGRPVYTVGKTAANCKAESKTYPGLCSHSDQPTSKSNSVYRGK